MSGVSGVSSNSVNPYDLLSRIVNSGSSTESTASTDSASNMQATFDQFLADFTSELEALGVDTESLKGLQEEIQTAVSTALAEAEESGETSDLRQVVQDAVDATLEANGFDVEELTQQMQTALANVEAEHGSIPPEGPGAQGIGPPPPPPSEGSDAESSTSEDSTDSLWDTLSTEETEESSSADRWLLQLMRELTSSSSGETDTSSQVNAAFEEATSSQDGLLGFLLDVET